MLTFNASVSDKKNLASINAPFQIMPSTTNTFTENTLAQFLAAGINNTDILIHLNYICRIFSSSALPVNSLARYILKQYKQLADSIHTKRILVHLPATSSEMDNIAIGFSIIREELPGYQLYFEIPAWSSSLRKQVTKESYMEEVLKYIDLKKEQLVFDTAHLFANGYSADEMISLFKKYKCDYCHLNGNERAVGTTDSHVAIFSSASKFREYDSVCKYLASDGTKIICVAEMTKAGHDWNEWTKFAKKYSFELVPFNKAFSI
jgi:endonuclease IV